MTDSVIRVALDVTPLLGPPTGVHQTTAGLLGALGRRDDVAVSGYVLSFRGRMPEAEFGELPVVSRRWPARLAHRMWRYVGIPPGRWMAGSQDVIHGTNYTAPPARTGRVVTVQDLTLVTHPKWCTRDVRRMFGPLKNVVRVGGHVHVTSRASAAEAVTHLGVSEDHLHVIPVAISPIGSGDADRGRALVGAERYVLALGTTEPRKGLAVLPPALAGIDRDVTLVVVGPSGSAESELDTAVTAAGVRDRYRRIGAVSNAVRSDLVRGAAALVYPSLAEGFGLPPLEALTVGCPVVATSVGALPELIGDHVELVPPDDLDAFTDQLRAVLDRPPPMVDELVERLSAMTWERAADEMVSVYRLAAD